MSDSGRQVGPLHIYWEIIRGSNWGVEKACPVGRMEISPSRVKLPSNSDCKAETPSILPKCAGDGQGRERPWIQGAEASLLYYTKICRINSTGKFVGASQAGRKGMGERSEARERDKTKHSEQNQGMDGKLPSSSVLLNKESRHDSGPGELGLRK